MRGDTGNSILDALPSAARRAFHKAALVDLPAGTELVNQGERIIHAFFPTTAVCSMVVELASGDKAETATVGSDGFVGVPLVLGAPVSHSSGIVQVPGGGYRLPAKQLLELCREHEGFRRALFGYTAFELRLASRSVACNSFHSVRQRLARWLLFTHDRAGTDEFPLTHEALSAVLGATRPRVTQAAARLRAEGVIAYERGRIRILERARLEAAACECYEETRRKP
ncbi:MAG: Crp/Fnr family transcriptional regulator [Betaproteobacteria bacterium]